MLRSVIIDYRRDKENPCPIRPPIQGEEFERVSEEYRHMKRLTAVLTNLVLNILLIIVISVICYSNRDDRSYRHTEYINNQMVDPNYIKKITLSPRFHHIKSPGDLFDWVNQTVFPSLFPETDLTGELLHWTLREHMNGYLNYRLGPPRLRQLRMNQDMCKLPYYGTVPCYNEYSISNEDTRDFCIGWTEKPCPSYMKQSNKSLPAWSFTSALDIWGYPIPGLYSTYGGGGYLANFYINRKISVEILNELFSAKWLDRQTRAVFLEFTLFCVSTNIFIYVSFLVEFPDTGGAVTTCSIYPLRLYSHEGPSGIVTLISEMIFVLYTCILLVRLCVKFYQERYGVLKSFWGLIDCVILLLSLSVVVVFFIRLAFRNMTIQKFRSAKKEFVNFSHIVLWDQVLVTCLDFLIFMATLRLLEIFGDTKKVRAISIIFRKCRRDLVSFGINVWYLFFGFCVLGTLLFGSQLYSYMSIYRAIGTLFLASLGVSKYSEMNNSYPILAKVFFMAYIVSIVYFVLSIFLSLLGASIDEAVQEMKNDKKQDLIEFIIEKIKSCFPNRGRPKQEAPEEPEVEESPPPSPEPVIMVSKGTSIGSSLVELSLKDIEIAD